MRYFGHPTPTLCLLLTVLALLGEGLVSSPGAAEGGQTVEITVEDCRRATRYLEPAGVAYEPGKDVYGRDVAPADLDGGSGRIELPEVLEFDVAFNPLSELAISGGTRDFSNTSVSLGRVTYDLTTKRLTFNGQTLSSDSEAELIAQCQRVLDGKQAY